MRPFMTRAGKSATPAKLDYATPPPRGSVRTLGLAKWGLFWGIVSILFHLTESGPSINGVQTSPMRWSAPGFQVCLCVIALWVCFRALRKIRRSVTPVGGMPLAITGACLAGLKLLMLYFLY